MFFSCEADGFHHPTKVFINFTLLRKKFYQINLKRHNKAFKLMLLENKRYLGFDDGVIISK